ncbi:ribosome biogenesis protein BRX1 homolog, putative [Plasmodium berghei]|uniref:Ribosome biogenesis protein BRX1, putative n=2 Tax=Plasmodium berghei TaxID=5821 RepID=A0A509AFE5_PLABA|nr:ribosome biogenesis protein BRX1, putative [Plasmodium berghei ANKA]CXH90042.1 ribosome biogenesis protein BRX1 homolog, putative [Plasmodium berghei]SCL90392.1 ribosome biogenesis protein BRX1 homolog, putative [Plasmodium berghei]SCM15286.1 ribosome biogenesis protein BRX1 homolog, putative [Plasmodium berghei]SCM17081.1 ribosome biogenesis protein BRX1 homolog, putative [Plasmodium berghei]SCN21993.1 ribosome biogenesis protein BRX1 homolog, putative [Plasmodium berghei]|eukprot:XP_034419861.1 ribosome biogenesis protein BRX1, putative [Plasmodium berghei ANKA]
MDEKNNDINDETECIKETTVKVVDQVKEKENEPTNDLPLEKKRKEHASNDDLPDPKKMPLIEESEEENEGEKEEIEDPYLLKDAKYIKKNKLWKTKQRVLIVRSPLKKKNCQSFVDNLKLLLPHHKMESKWSKKGKKIDLSNICYSRNCNNLIFFDIKRNRYCLWICKNITGPSLYFEILDYIPLHSLSFPGNCLLYSRPLLIFSKQFDELEHLKLIKEIFIHVFGTPKYHPLSKPFYDHCYNFYYIKDLIYFRHYQILPTTLADSNNINKQKLVEIGPQFTLHIIKIFDQFFKGNVIYENLKYKNCETSKQKKIKQNIKKKVTSIKKKKSYVSRVKFIHTPIKTDIDF